jgi:hypothetical protein
MADIGKAEEFRPLVKVVHDPTGGLLEFNAVI